VLLKNVEDRAAIGVETAQKHDEKRSLFFTAYCTLNKGHRQKSAQKSPETWDVISNPQRHTQRLGNRPNFFHVNFRHPHR
jgi:hypothetical protein